MKLLLNVFFWLSPCVLGLASAWAFCTLSGRAGGEGSASPAQSRREAETASFRAAHEPPMRHRPGPSDPGLRRSVALPARPLSRQVWATVTAYCPCSKCCGKWADGKTAIGRNAKRTRGVAVDGTLIKLRSKVRIPGAGPLPFLADDCGGAMRQSARRGRYHVDLRFPTHGEALQWGRKRLLITIIEE